MQDRYAGDIGDYVKLAILRALRPDHKLGVAWWLFPDEIHNADGRHIGYLDQPDRWRRFDPNLFDGLKRLVNSGQRRVVALQAENFLSDTLFFDEQIPVVGRSADRRQARELWFRRVLETVKDCDLVFLDPDNGLETKSFDSGAAKAGKSVSLAELQALRRPNRTVVVYHHQTRMPGGHLSELSHWGGRLRAVGFNSVDALRASPFSARAFFLLDASEVLRRRAEELAKTWGDSLLTWHPNLGQPDMPLRLDSAAT